MIIMINFFSMVNKIVIIVNFQSTSITHIILSCLVLIIESTLSLGIHTWSAVRTLSGNIADIY